MKGKSDFNRDLDRGSGRYLYSWQLYRSGAHADINPLCATVQSLPETVLQLTDSEETGQLMGKKAGGILTGIRMGKASGKYSSCADDHIIDAQRLIIVHHVQSLRRMARSTGEMLQCPLQNKRQCNVT